MRKNKFITVLVFCSIFILSLSVNNTFAQRNKNKIKLTKDARKNGYEISKKRGKIYVQAKNVVDPITKKLLEGLHELEFICKNQDEIQKLKNIIFKNGSTKPLLVICEDVEGEALATLVVNKLR